MEKRIIKKILGELPYTVELYWHLIQRHKPWTARYNLNLLESNLAEAVSQVEPFAQTAVSGKRVFIFATLHYWIEFSTFLALTLAGKGHKVTFSYLPYANWDKPINKFNLRGQNLYTRQVLNQASQLIKIQPLLDVLPFSRALPKELEKAVEEVSTFDTQYTLQVEDIDKSDPLYQLRYERNRLAAQNARAWLAAHKPDVIILPNGTIQEMGILFRVAQYFDIPTVTFEFGDKREHIWLAQNDEIMRHDTSSLWAARGNEPLKEDQLEQLHDLFSARQDAKTWKNFTRQWQDTPTEGGSAVRKKLNLDDRPVVLLATNVLGDSLTLDRQVFSRTMADWIEKSLNYFSDRKDVQLIIRVHPGETLTHGTSMVDVVKNELSDIPDHIHLILPEEKINTYDILDIADLGLVYTTTVGLEMAMRGIPVVVAGETHYRDRGFTCDPNSWNEYVEILNTLLGDLEHARLSQDQIELAWRYAYLFFFEFPKPFPWHLLDFKKDIISRPLEFVLGEEGQKRYNQTFEYLTGTPLEW
jgi:hypothetical protein